MKTLRKNPFRSYRLTMLGSAIALVPLGYLLRFYGPGPAWLDDALGSAIYEIFWIALGLGIWPNVAPLKIAAIIGIATCALEILQLWHPPFLQALRATLPGRLILGTTFSWRDFPAYLGGSIVGYGWGRSRLPRRAPSQTPLP
ncbi:DUF2809 domain-containing protein [Altericista sp. CCNU0014]|uniref:ribosomal maturation YjgA family protein n=1 Tax=Altericista sp. CCNU0014 TaxID=3082949 RepID=UPI00384BE116